MTDIVKTAPFVQARQASFDAFQKSLTLQGQACTSFGPTNRGFFEGFNRGALFGIDTMKAKVGEAELAARSQTAPNIGKRAGKVADLILTDLRTNGPATAERIAERIGVRLNSVSPRFAKLVSLGLVNIVSGELGSRANKAVYASVHNIGSQQAQVPGGQ